MIAHGVARRSMRTPSPRTSTSVPRSPRFRESPAASQAARSLSPAPASRSSSTKRTALQQLADKQQQQQNGEASLQSRAILPESNDETGLQTRAAQTSDEILDTTVKTLKSERESNPGGDAEIHSNQEPIQIKDSDSKAIET